MYFILIKLQSVNLGLNPKNVHKVSPGPDLELKQKLNRGLGGQLFKKCILVPNVADPAGPEPDCFWKVNPDMVKFSKLGGMFTPNLTLTVYM